MSEQQHISTVTHEIEARLLLEQEYDEEYIEDIMDIYKDVVKHIGFEDNRRDERFVVKFHDVFYYEPYELEEDKDACTLYNDLFDEFCNDQYEYVIDDLQAMGIDGDKILTRYDVGHYKTFELHISNITQDNALDVTKEIWENDLGCKYASDYVYTVNLLQNLEDNYMADWIEFLKINEFPDTYIKEIEDAYNKDHNNQPQQPQQLKEK